MEAAKNTDANLGFCFYFYAIDGIFRVVDDDVENARRSLEEYLTRPVTRRADTDDAAEHEYIDIPYSVILFGDHDYRLDFKPVTIPYDPEKQEHHEILLRKGYPLAKIALIETVTVRISTPIPSIDREPTEYTTNPNQLTLFE